MRGTVSTLRRGEAQANTWLRFFCHLPDELPLEALLDLAHPGRSQAQRNSKRSCKRGLQGAGAPSASTQVPGPVRRRGLGPSPACGVSRSSLTRLRGRLGLPSDRRHSALSCGVMDGPPASSVHQHNCPGAAILVPAGMGGSAFVLVGPLGPAFAAGDDDIPGTPFTIGY